MKVTIGEIDKEDGVIQLGRTITNGPDGTSGVEAEVRGGKSGKSKGDKPGKSKKH